MDAGVAQNMLKKYVAWSTDPVLAQADIDLLMMACRTTDVNQVNWLDASWVPTFDLEWASSVGWLWKAGACADRYNFHGDDTSLHRDQVHDHCLAMAKLYKQRANNKVHVLRAAGNLVVDRYGLNSLFPVGEEVIGN